MSFYFSGNILSVLVAGFIAGSISYPVAAVEFGVHIAGWDAMCARFDQPIDFCKSYPGPRQVTFTNELGLLLSRTNREVNARYHYRDDIKIFLVKDFWTVPPKRTADCEDYAMAKMLELYNAGVPMSAMVLIANTMPSGIWHARLGVYTDAGTIVLDNQKRDAYVVKGVDDAIFYLNMYDNDKWHIAF